MMRRLRFLRVVYMMPLLMLAFWPVNVQCSQCGGRVLTESLIARWASGFEENFLCGPECAEQYLVDNPLERDVEGRIIPKW